MSARLPFVLGTALLAASLTSVRVARAADENHDVTLGGRQVRLWLPDGVKVVRGIVVYANMASGDTRVAPAKWAEFGRRYGFGHLGTMGFGANASGADGQALLDALDQIATKTGRRELRNVPFIGAGFSSGGNFAYNLAIWKPERVIAFNADKGCCYTGTAPSLASLKTPGILVSGQNDTEQRRSAQQKIFDVGRAQGALWAHLEQEGTGHDTNGTHHLFMPFFAHAIEKRYPAAATPLDGPVQLLPLNEADGYLADNATWKSDAIQYSPFAAYQGDKSKASWLPDEETAFLFRAFGTYGGVAAIDSAEGLATTAGGTLEVPVTATKLPAGWTKLEIFRGMTKLLERTAGMSTTLSVSLPAGLYALNGVVTDGAGKQRYVKPKVVVFHGEGVAVPPPSSDAGAPPALGDAGAPLSAPPDAAVRTSIDTAAVTPPATEPVSPTAPPSTGKKDAAAPKPADPVSVDPEPTSKGGGGCAVGDSSETAPWAVVFVLLAIVRRRFRAGAN